MASSLHHSFYFAPSFHHSYRTSPTHSSITLTPSFSFLCFLVPPLQSFYYCFSTSFLFSHSPYNFSGFLIFFCSRSPSSNTFFFFFPTLAFEVLLAVTFFFFFSFYVLLSLSLSSVVCLAIMSTPCRLSLLGFSLYICASPRLSLTSLSLFQFATFPRTHFRLSLL